MTWWQIIVGLILTCIIYLKSKRYLKHLQAIGQRVTIEYADQNNNLETIFPMTGTITRNIKVGKQNMFVLNLDTSFSYDKKDYKNIIIAERHVGRYIGTREEIHIHILLPKTELTKERYLLNDFHHVVWATVKPIE